VHGWWNLGGAKMSKSAGNIIDPFVLADKYGSDALRYYLMSDIAIGKDADFSEERLVERYNADLANTLGNLLNRTLNMAHRYRDGKITCIYRNSSSPDDEIEEDVPEPDPSSLTITIALRPEAEEFVDLITSEIDEFALSDALIWLPRFSRSCNQTIDIVAPWKKSRDPDFRAMIDEILYAIVESLRLIAILISPVLPKAAHGIFDQLNWKMELSGKEERFSLKDAQWGGLPDGHVVGKPVPLFPRIEIT